MNQNILGDGIGSITLTDWMGGDLSVVNDAKASYGKQVTQIGEKEAKLIQYLGKHGHWSPLRGVVLKFSVKAPIFVCRQW